MFGLFDRNVGLTAKYAMVKVSDNVVEEEPLSQTRVNTTYTKNKTLVGVCQPKQWKVCMSDQQIENSSQSCKQGL